MKNAHYYLNLPWTYTVETTTETGELLYVVGVAELPGLKTDAPSLAQAMQSLKDLMLDEFQHRIDTNKDIPMDKNS